jgi:hypothetical protein
MLLGLSRGPAHEDALRAGRYPARQRAETRSRSDPRIREPRVISLR